jgi:hypothetical protein
MCSNIKDSKATCKVFSLRSNKSRPFPPCLAYLRTTTRVRILSSYNKILNSVAIVTITILDITLYSFHKLQQAWYLPITEERYWALFYMPLYTFLHNLLNVSEQTANKMGVQKKARIHRPVFYWKHDVSLTGFYICLQVEPGPGPETD